MTIGLLLKSIVIALAAAIAAWLPMALFLTSDTDSNLAAGYGLALLPLALAGCFAVGLPIALLSYFLSGKAMMRSASTAFLAANFAGLVLLLLTFSLGDLFGAFFYGIPSLIAANVFAGLGWFWILKPLREKTNA